jgi:hypothetical protein
MQQRLLLYVNSWLAVFYSINDAWRNSPLWHSFVAASSHTYMLQISNISATIILELQTNMGRKEERCIQEV